MNVHYSDENLPHFFDEYIAELDDSSQDQAITKLSNNYIWDNFYIRGLYHALVTDNTQTTLNTHNARHAEPTYIDGYWDGKHLKTTNTSYSRTLADNARTLCILIMKKRGIMP